MNVSGDLQDDEPDLGDEWMDWHGTWTTQSLRAMTRLKGVFGRKEKRRKRTRVRARVVQDPQTLLRVDVSRKM